jgi:hypothetical protein
MLKLATGEVIVKEWDYAQAKSAGEKTVANLAVTNKRIIYTAESKRGISREEIPLDSVKMVYFGSTKEQTGMAIFYIIFGAIFAVTIIGLPLLILGIRMLIQASFNIEIVTKGREGTSLYVGVVKMFGKKKKPRIKVKINKKACVNIVEEFGAAMMEARSMN